jgi:tRNA(fMet)-specific endonuclease VapC
VEYTEILVDTSVLIDFFRKKNRKKSLLYRLQQRYKISVSSITEFEFLAGIKEERVRSLKYFFENLHILPFDSNAAMIASTIYKDLKGKNQIIEFRDILIGATAMANKLPLSTLNIDHFSRIENLTLI